MEEDDGKLFKQASVLMDDGRFEEAIVMFKKLIQSDPDDFLLRMLLGQSQLSTGEFDRAIAAFRTAQTIRPDSEWASVGVFHSLCGAKREDEAFEEMSSFCAKFESEEYDKLRKEIGENSN